MNKKPRCDGKRYQFRNGKFALHKCNRSATGIVEVNVGVSKHFHVCDDDACFSFITGGYPGKFTAFKKQ